MLMLLISLSLCVFNNYRSYFWIHLSIIKFNRSTYLYPKNVLHEGSIVYVTFALKYNNNFNISVIKLISTLVRLINSID